MSATPLIGMCDTIWTLLLRWVPATDPAPCAVAGVLASIAETANSVALRTPHSAFRIVSAHLLRFRRSIRPVVPVLRARDVGQAPLLPIPAVEPFHLERPEPRSAGNDQAIGVSHVYAKRALHAALTGRVAANK